MSTAYAPYDKDAFFRAVLGQLGYPVTEWRLSFFRQWAAGENTGAGFNPLATTRVDPAVRVDSNWNDNGGNPVKNYASFEDGVLATVQTIRLDYYTLIRQSLQEQRVVAGAGSQMRTWGTLAFAAQLDAGTVATDRFALSLISPMEGGTLSGGWREVYTGVLGRPPYQHGGLDYVHVSGVTLGKPVRAAAGGIIKMISLPNDGSWDDFGEMCIIDHVGTVYWTLYGHMIPGSLRVRNGQAVAQGETLGLAGDSGAAVGHHLHFALSNNPALPDFDPMRYSEGGVMVLGNPHLIDPTPFFGAASPTIPTLPEPVGESTEALMAVRELNEAIMLRNAITRIGLDPDYERVKQAAAALRAAGFVL